MSSWRRLYRSQLATARFFDTHSGLKSLLSLALAGEVGSGSASAPALAGARALQRDFFAGATRYAPPRSLADFVRDSYRRTDVGDVGTARAAAELCHVEMVRLADLSQIHVESDDGATAAHVAATASVIAGAPILEGQFAEASAIRPGVLLLEHPAEASPGRSVVLVYDITRNVGDDSSGSGPSARGNISSSADEETWVLRGFVTNRPHLGTLADVSGIRTLGQLGELPCFSGGPMGAGAISIVHGFRDLEGALPVDGPLEDVVSEDVPLPDARCGLFVGGSAAAINDLLSAGRATASDFRVYIGRLEIPLIRPAKGAADDLSLPDADRWIAAAGPGVAGVVHCPSLLGAGPYADAVGLRENVVGCVACRVFQRFVSGEE